MSAALDFHGVEKAVKQLLLDPLIGDAVAMYTTTAHDKQRAIFPMGLVECLEMIPRGVYHPLTDANVNVVVMTSKTDVEYPSTAISEPYAVGLEHSPRGNGVIEQAEGLTDTQIASAFAAHSTLTCHKLEFRNIEQYDDNDDVLLTNMMFALILSA